MSVTIITEDIKKRSGDIIIETISLPQKTCAFSECIENLIGKKDDRFYMGIEFRNSRLKCCLTELWNSKYKFVAHILSDNEDRNVKYSDYNSALGCIFHYMKCEEFKTVILSLDQYKKFVGESEYNLLNFLETMTVEAMLYDINIKIVVESEELKKDIINCETNNIYREYMQENNNDNVIYNKIISYYEQTDREKNIVNNYQLNKYIEGSEKKAQFRKKLLEYIVRSGLSEAKVAKKAEMNKGTLSKIKNGKILPTRNCAMSLGIVLGLNINEFTEFMEAAGQFFPLENGSLEAKRDSVIKFLLEHDYERNIVKINDFLDKKRLELLGEKHKE